jgi:hypothetical protein
MTIYNTEVKDALTIVMLLTITNSCFMYLLTVNNIMIYQFSSPTKKAMPNIYSLLARNVMVCISLCPFGITLLKYLSTEPGFMCFCELWQKGFSNVKIISGS